jgi:hypothetical protein
MHCFYPFALPRSVYPPLKAVMDLLVGISDAAYGCVRATGIGGGPVG